MTLCSLWTMKLFGSGFEFLKMAAKMCMMKNGVEYRQPFRKILAGSCPNSERKQTLYNYNIIYDFSQVS